MQNFRRLGAKLAKARGPPLFSPYDSPWTDRSHHRRRAGHRPGHRASFCQGRRVRFPYRAHHEQLASSTAEILQQGGQAAFAAADITSEADCRRIVADAREKFGSVSILVNNAGHYGPVLPVEEYPLAEFDKVIAVHLRACFLLTQLVLPEMYARERGVILNISSLSAKAAFPWGSAYAAAKAGMLGLTRITAAEAARKGVRVNAICPGPVTETVMSQELGATLARKLGVSSEEQLAGFLQTILQGRGQTAEEIARAALFLCSDASSAMTGQSMNVDGGAAFF